MTNANLGAWLHAVTSTVAAVALVGAFVLYGDVRAVQEYAKSDARKVDQHAKTMEKLADIITEHAKLLAQMGTLCAENFHHFERLEPRMAAVEGKQWTADMEIHATRALQREMDGLAHDVEKNAARIESLSADWKEMLRDSN